MSRERFERYWRGLVITLMGVAAVLWIAATGKLGWYVHPRYALFAVGMCAVAAVVLIAAVPAVLRSRGREAEDPVPGAERSEPAVRGRTAMRRLAVIGNAVLIAGAAAALLVVPPVTLTNELAAQRQMTASSGGKPLSAVGDVRSAGASAVGEEATVRDWAAQLQRDGGAEVEGREAELLGFVMADPQGSDDVLLVSRFAISCCAVDALPIGVPVHAPQWRESLSEGDWVTVAGVFVANPDAAGAHGVLLRPASIAAAEEPEDPYVY